MSGWIDTVEEGFSMVYVNWFQGGKYIMNTPKHVEGTWINSIIYYANQIRFVLKFIPNFFCISILFDGTKF